MTYWLSIQAIFAVYQNTLFLLLSAIGRAATLLSTNNSFNSTVSIPPEMKMSAHNKLPNY